MENGTFAKSIQSLRSLKLTIMKLFIKVIQKKDFQVMELYVIIVCRTDRHSSTIKRQAYNIKIQVSLSL